MSQTPSKYVYFRVDFDWFTSFIRQLWAEGSYRKALGILSEDMNISSSDGFAIIRGTMKMAQNPKGKEGIDGIIEKDNWKPDLTRCAWGQYPDPEDLPRIEQKRDFFAKKYLEQCVEEIYVCQRELNNPSSRLYGDGLSILDIEKRLFYLPDEAFDLAGVNKGDLMIEIGELQVEYLQQESKKALLDQYFQHQRELDTKPLPKPDKEMLALYGWLLPNGKYYPCDWQDHIWLAEKLGKSEKEAEADGWIKFTKSGIWPPMEDDFFPTPKQQEAVRLWCEVHQEPEKWEKFSNQYK